MKTIGVNNKLREDAERLVNESMKRTELLQLKEVEGLSDFLKELVFLSLNRGFIHGVETMNQTSELLLKELREIKKNVHEKESFGKEKC